MSQKIEIALASGQLEELFSRYSRELYWIALAFCSNKELAEDAVQETFLQICEHPDRLSGVTNIRSYLISATKHYLIDYFRRLQIERRHESNLTEEYDYLLSSQYSEDEYQEMLSRVRTFLDPLPPACRRIFVMAVVDGLSYKEIADRERISVNTVKSQLRIANKKLKGNTILVLFILLQVLK